MPTLKTISGLGRRILCGLTVMLSMLVASAAWGQAPGVRTPATRPAQPLATQAKPAPPETTVASPAAPEPIPPALESYMGREIAQTMHFSGAPWLIRENREDEERCSIMLGQLGVKPGMTICDMGCGNGFYSVQLAKMVGPTGRVLCVDIQPEMLRLLERRAVDQGVDNIVPILGAVHDPRLPKASVDLILMVDVYHEFSHTEQMLRNKHASHKPDGQIALLEYRAEDPNVPIKPLHKMSKKQIIKEFSPNGFRLVREFNRLPWQHMMFFGLSPEE